MSNALQDKGIQILADRGIWERKQRLYYSLRHDGLRRINKPGPWAADQHMPLIDMNINDLKPFWSAQVFGGQRLCDFVAMRKQLSDTTESAADYHDFTLRNFTNYRYMMERVIDTMLLRGRGVLLATANPFKDHRIEFQAIDPLYILMPQQFDDFEDSDYWIWAQTLSVPQYLRNRNYNHDPDVLRAIRGRKDYQFQSIEYDKQLREGITHSSRDDEIVLWHHWEKTESGWIINTYSPQASDKKIRDAWQCPYEAGGEASCPFSSYTMEIKGEGGWYAPRGIAELNAAFEAYACTLWNNKTDAMRFGNTPLFTSEGDIQNTSNLRFNPGEFVPGNIRAVEMPQPAYSFDQEINFSRGLAEQRARIPDFGITDQSAPGDSNKPRTATENNRIAGLQNVGADYNGDVFRAVRLLKLYKHTWALMVQFKPKRISYYVGNDLKELSQQALHDEYLVVPLGGPANKNEKLQRAGQRFVAFKGQPNIDQDELSKDVLAADDSRLIPRLLIPSNQKQATEAYQEDVEIGVLSMGRPVPVLPNQDHATRIMELVHYLHAQTVLKTPHDPIASQRINEHLMQHFALLKQTQPQAARQVLQQVQQLEMASAGSQTSTGATNGAPASPSQTANGNGAGNGAPKLSESITMKLADFYPSERAQILGQLGIRSASPQEMMQVEGARAQIKQASVKPKIEGALE